MVVFVNIATRFDVVTLTILNFYSLLFSGFTVYTWMMATFFWMNVISINVFRTVL